MSPLCSVRFARPPRRAGEPRSLPPRWRLTAKGSLAPSRPARAERRLGRDQMEGREPLDQEEGMIDDGDHVLVSLTPSRGCSLLPLRQCFVCAMSACLCCSPVSDSIRLRRRQVGSGRYMAAVATATAGWAPRRSCSFGLMWVHLGRSEPAARQVAKTTIIRVFLSLMGIGA